MQTKAKTPQPYLPQNKKKPKQKALQQNRNVTKTSSMDTYITNTHNQFPITLIENTKMTNIIGQISCIL
ncbi:hypothetical protein MMJ63_21690, partial [Bacillus vallismortis]|nr:hypothetical protein [Bacillus vallismortis]